MRSPFEFLRPRVTQIPFDRELESQNKGPEFSGDVRLRRGGNTFPEKRGWVGARLLVSRPRRNKAAWRPVA